MPYFKDDAEVYKYIGGLFQQLTEDEELTAKMDAAGVVVQYQYKNPASQITMGLVDGNREIVFGPTDIKPDVVMTMDADIAHEFWLGKVNVTVALARGQMRAKGPVAKILKLVPITQQIFPRYKALLEKEGRADLIKE